MLVGAALLATGVIILIGRGMATADTPSTAASATPPPGFAEAPPKSVVVPDDLKVKAMALLASDVLTNEAWKAAEPTVVFAPWTNSSGDLIGVSVMFRTTEVVTLAAGRPVSPALAEGEMDALLKASPDLDVTRLSAPAATATHATSIIAFVPLDTSRVATLDGLPDGALGDVFSRNGEDITRLGAN